MREQEREKIPFGKLEGFDREVGNQQKDPPVENGADTDEAVQSVDARDIRHALEGVLEARHLKKTTREHRGMPQHQ